ncbi:MAG: thiamine diphosphokinase [Dethiobacter sp.]|jgi:thiamine pyrophosphokinase|nr:MAG: thiamine diphosphokinase [Dethiobacter sp.]
MKVKRVVIIANGTLNNLDFYRRQIRAEDYIVCADGGANHVLAMGLIPHLVVGDLDSIDHKVRQKLCQYPTAFLQYPSEKEKSDLELALDKAVELGPEEIIIIGAFGGRRLDHTFANIMLMNVPLNCGAAVTLFDEDHEIRLVDSEAAIKGRVGDYLSLLPLTAEVKGVVTEGLKYPLQGETLYFSSTRGLSNEFIETEGRIKVSEGKLLVIKVKKGDLKIIFGIKTYNP